MNGVPAIPLSGLAKLPGSNLRLMLDALPGCGLFKHLMVQGADGVKFDAVKDGEVSCALVVSSVLAMVNLIDQPHATVATTLDKMVQAGWRQVERPILGGTVTVWPPNPRGHMHIGFFIGEQTYLSNDETKGVPARHGPVLIDGRGPSAYYAHPALAN